jgi:hypothetical protein
MRANRGSWLDMGGNPKNGIIAANKAQKIKDTVLKEPFTHAIKFFSFCEICLICKIS